MKANPPERNFVDSLLEEIKTLWRHVRDAGGTRSQTHGTRSLLTAPEFQEELAVLGLSGKKFVPRDYADALGDYLGISINIHIIPDAWQPETSRRLALSGRLGELRYSEQLALAAILVPGSLPPLVLTLTIFHELGHLAAGDVLLDPQSERLGLRYQHPRDAEFMTVSTSKGKMLGRGLPFADEAIREREANLRASYALFAGCLGDDSPYAYAVYSEL